ncbi:hypothetical protein GE21DRAFT_457 [Neurospora crassa]|uniref:Tim44-like domain-containing protein n=2 Tax=Neurospora crassa TaxID=5141 RepID=V5INW8_NEUCR|nr:uncharacterized protein NCU01983 [Neurospora crassa OR74A]XP_011392922.1 hypothetical protein NCU01983 [Neurospora crassa OR74A]ESA43832.1 hypothetical protein NCU01983 [Neurospora crassa OR74A]ESA43833.1 hypothetical protein, variant [Neurospora crassa OR74A]KHE89176.1 hypothetical protein GE21DRAFT_457 [Neurospora crassa]|eukprot:XP_011392921.1 uncharacterized protein NCU01983 [Neurospora crassa OR74A]
MLAVTKLGLRARLPGSLATTTTTTSPVMAVGRALFSTSENRAAANRRTQAAIRKHTGNAVRQTGKQPAPSLERAKLDPSKAPTFVLPETFVIPPLSRFPKQFKPLMSYLWGIIRVKSLDFLLARQYRFSSMPGWRQKPLLSLKKAPLIAQTKALHRQMNEAIASGDAEMLEKIVDSYLYVPLAVNIEQRPKGRTCTWELVRYNKEPRIVSHKIFPLQGTKDKLLWQVTVSIASRQRVVEHERGRVVPGSEKELDLVENVVIGTMISNETWATQNAWKIISTVQPMTPEKWEREQETVKLLAEAGAGSS